MKNEIKRRMTREVMIGNVGVGGNNPVRIQSMTTSDTRDVEATVEQIIRLGDAGCEIARVTVQGMKEAHACEKIKSLLIQKGYQIPLVADIHFYPPAAMNVADFVDKVRINPGNFVDKRASFKLIEYDDALYQKELEKIEEKFAPLVLKCKQLKRAMRIGTNHGSLSDRIMNRYGDTPEGMVESALEFAHVCRKYDYHDIIFSMKASNPLVMIRAYRLLVAAMDRLGWNYPLHLGVTEAGEGEDGRVKSAIGIGALLLEGLGDTIRVSLTEDPWYEIDPCRRLVALDASYPQKDRWFDRDQPFLRRAVSTDKIPFFHRDGSVFLEITEKEISSPTFFSDCGLGLKKEIATVDAVVIREEVRNPANLKKLERLQEGGVRILSSIPMNKATPLYSLMTALEKKSGQRFTAFPKTDSCWGLIIDDLSADIGEKVDSLRPSFIILSLKYGELSKARSFFNEMKKRDLNIPVILSFIYDQEPEDLMIAAAAENGALLCDGLGDGISLRGKYPLTMLRSLSFNILQGCRRRAVKTEFISCPSCGRTLFNLQEVSKQIRERTVHLAGVKIAIMGCIVNGPGEMADADFGYVGSKPGMIDLYVGKNCVEKNILFDAAPERLVDLIKQYGRWVEPNNSELLLEPPSSKQ